MLVMVVVVMIVVVVMVMVVVTSFVVVVVVPPCESILLQPDKRGMGNGGGDQRGWNGWLRRARG